MRIRAIGQLQPLFRRQWKVGLTVLLFALSSFLTACDLPQVSAEERTFLNLTLNFLGEYQLPKDSFDGSILGGISAIAYDRQRDRLYALSDDRSEPRFYTLKLKLKPPGPEYIDAIASVDIEAVTLLKDKNGNPYPPGEIDPEGIALTPQGTLFISSEGDVSANIPPAIEEFDLKTGNWQQRLPLPERYVPVTAESKQVSGVQINSGFEALTTNPLGTIPAAGEPIRVFTVTESALVQDLPDLDTDDASIRNRWLHYYLTDAPPVLLSEHLYVLDPQPVGTLLAGVTEIAALDSGGHFLSLERSLGLTGFIVKLFQLYTGDATDISGVTSLKGSLAGLQPIRKQLLLDLNQLNITLDNLEGMTLGPRLPNGSPSLLLVSDDNFRDDQVTQLLLFSLS